MKLRGSTREIRITDRTMDEEKLEKDLKVTKEAGGITESGGEKAEKELYFNPAIVSSLLALVLLVVSIFLFGIKRGSGRDISFSPNWTNCILNGNILYYKEGKYFYALDGKREVYKLDLPDDQAKIAYSYDGLFIRATDGTLLYYDLPSGQKLAEKQMSDGDFIACMSDESKVLAKSDRLMVLDNKLNIDKVIGTSGKPIMADRVANGLIVISQGSKKEFTEEGGVQWDPGIAPPPKEDFDRQILEIFNNKDLLLKLPLNEKVLGVKSLGDKYMVLMEDRLLVFDGEKISASTPLSGIKAWKLDDQSYILTGRELLKVSTGGRVTRTDLPFECDFLAVSDTAAYCIGEFGALRIVEGKKANSYEDLDIKPLAGVKNPIVDNLDGSPALVSAGGFVFLDSVKSDKAGTKK